MRTDTRLGGFVLVQELPSVLVHGALASVTSRLSPALHPLQPCAPLTLVLGARIPLGFCAVARVFVSQRLPAVASSDGAGLPSNQFPTASRKKWYTDLPCWTQVAIAVQMRSQKRRPLSLRVPCVMCRSITTKRIACSA